MNSTENLTLNVGKKVWKKTSRKPFKSGNLFNTVKSIINHPQLNIPAYTFEEDDSYVECRRCYPASEEEIENNSN